MRSSWAHRPVNTKMRRPRHCRPGHDDGRHPAGYPDACTRRRPHRDRRPDPGRRPLRDSRHHPGRRPNPGGHPIEGRRPCHCYRAVGRAAAVAVAPGCRRPSDSLPATPTVVGPPPLPLPLPARPLIPVPLASLDVPHPTQPPDDLATLPLSRFVTRPAPAAPFGDARNVRVTTVAAGMRPASSTPDQPTGAAPNTLSRSWMIFRVGCYAKTVAAAPPPPPESGSGPGRLP